MAIVECMKEYEEAILNKLGIDYKGLYWGELGNQSYNGKPAKIIYNLKGVRHTSIDLNGRDGALPLDLSKPITQTFNFDVLTNYGTIEHCEDQYEAFRNAHNLVKIGGLTIHGLPMKGNWPNHGRYYYSMSFPVRLSRLCDYEIVDFKIWDSGFYLFPRNLVYIIFVKKRKDFIDKDRFNLINGLYDSGDTRHTQNYDN